MSNKNKRWGEDEIQYLKDNAKNFTAEYIALRLGRTVSGVREFASRRKIKFSNSRPWEFHEIRFLENNCESMKPAEIAAKLNRDVQEIRNKAARMGIKFGFWSKVSDHDVALCKTLFNEGMSIEDIAEKMEISHGTVKSYIYGWRRKNVTALAG